MDGRHHSSEGPAAPRRSVRADLEPPDRRVGGKRADAGTPSPGRRPGALADVRQLQNCLNDLVSVLALPAMWRHQEPPVILRILIDALVGMLRLDFAYGWLKTEVNGAPLDIVRVAGRYRQDQGERDVRRLFTPWLECRTVMTNAVLPNPLGQGTVSIAPYALGVGQEMGIVVVASDRADFPTETESLLTSVAVNLAVVELQRSEIAAARTRADESERARDDLLAENIYLRGELETERNWDEVVGRSEALRRVLALVEQVAPTPACVLIQGETGTGKELIARAIHRFSGRRDRPFVKLNCAAIPTGLLESELFGHEKGAFTSAVGQKVGRFEIANRGTIFLDEVGEIPLELQAKLLRVLQEQEFERLGGTHTIRVDVRLVAASNRDLAQMVEDRQFRSDLYYRLCVFPIKMPPLRDRTEDIPLLVRHFTKRYARQFGKPITSVPSRVMTALCEYAWPGNVREMENLIARSVILSSGPFLAVALGELKSRADTPLPAPTLEDLERTHILDALTQSRWVLSGPSGAAARLGLKRTSLQYKMQKLGISRPR
jgi:transcriptional regulator with GAF, ATPase, and Fis domain